MDEPAAEKRCNGTGRGRRSGHRGIRSPTQKSCDLARKGKGKKREKKGKKDGLPPIRDTIGWIVVRGFHALG